MPNNVFNISGSSAPGGSVKENMFLRGLSEWRTSVKDQIESIINYSDAPEKLTRLNETLQKIELVIAKEAHKA